jgi:IS5 family transposase
LWWLLRPPTRTRFPELEDYLASLSRLGLAVVLTPGARGKPRPYSFSYAKRIAREARRKAGLSKHVALTACRHGGMTELGDAALTEAQTMALSGHKTPDAARLYVKRTDVQRVTNRAKAPGMGRDGTKRWQETEWG